MRMEKMRGKKAKQLRREIYKDYSQRAKRKLVHGSNGGLINTGLRGAYQAAKKRG
jgi:hypothetical protein